MGNYHALSLLFFSPLLSSALSAELCHPDDKKAPSESRKPSTMPTCSPRGPLTLTAVTVGPIPQAIARLKYLQSLWISHTNITGPVPGFLGQLTELYYINLSVNKLTGTIPPSLSNLHKLEAIFLERNQLTGSVPESFGGLKNNKDLYLRLAKNTLSGPLPKSPGPVDFTAIDLSRNQLTGLQDVDLSTNQFSFNISEVVFLKDIYGTLPLSLAKLSNLQLFNVSYNRLCGPIPTGGNLDRFNKYCYAHNKCLCGSPLPPCP
ncbi:hypothetical protein Cgig2_012142 [Carnegiea gigantea]|uniref:Uncharacterized protein n=1 Tax=Carnegiea gigantea TaxID=171969 RepID=A0A9Q1QMT2_9CARY|nr:hypothetical protein Cgig2_012142 [Carnegiea gigantea]